MHRLTLTQIGDTLGVILSADLLAGFGLNSDKPIYLADTPDGLLLTPYDTQTRQQLSAGRELLRDHGTALRVLSK